MTKIEHYMTPEDFQDRLTEVGGRNLYDEANFRVWWGQGDEDVSLYRTGGRWSVDEQHFIGYRDLLKSGEACWCLGMWHHPDEYGTPESWYIQNYDEETGLQILGEFPYDGKVELLYPMRYREMVDGNLHLEIMPLSDYVLDTIVPIILDAQDISIEKQRAAILEQKAREEEAKVSSVEARLRETATAFGTNEVSYTRQGIRTPAIDAKVQSMTRRWDEISRRAKDLRKGFTTRTEGIK